MSTMATWGPLVSLAEMCILSTVDQILQILGSQSPKQWVPRKRRQFLLHRLVGMTCIIQVQFVPVSPGANVQRAPQGKRPLLPKQQLQIAAVSSAHQTSERQDLSFKIQPKDTKIFGPTETIKRSLRYMQTKSRNIVGNDLAKEIISNTDLGRNVSRNLRQRARRPSQATLQSFPQLHFMR